MRRQMDRRQIKTRKAIIGAFTELLEEKGYSAITIQDIVDRADIGRSSFYSHFDAKDDLLNGLCEGIFDHVFSGGGKEATHDFSGSRDLGDELTHILYHIREKKDSIRSILSSESGDVFMKYFRLHLKDLFSRNAVSVPEGIPEDYVISAGAGSFSEAVRWWIDNDNYSPEEIAGFFLESIRPGIFT